MSTCRPPRAAVQRAVLARQRLEPPPPLRLLQRWQPPAAGPSPSRARLPRWQAALRWLLGR